MGVQDHAAPAERLGWTSPVDSLAAAVPDRPLRRRLGPSALPSRIPSRGKTAAAGGDGTVASASAAPPSSDRPAASSSNPLAPYPAPLRPLLRRSRAPPLLQSKDLPRMPSSRTCLAQILIRFWRPPSGILISIPAYFPGPRHVFYV
jgi:hypothetical protein